MKKDNFCSCFPVTVEENIERSQLIFTGKVLQVDTLHTIPDYFIKNKSATEDNICCYTTKYLVKLKSDRIYKGKMHSDTIYIMTGQGGGDCGYYFKLNSDYLIYARSEEYYMLDFNAKPKITQKEFYSTTDCDRTTDLIKKESTLLEAALKKTSQ